MAGTITSLQYQKRNRERVNVYLDGRFAFGLAAIVAAQLRVGQVLGDDDITRLGGRDEVEKAYERALNFLSYRPRSETEVRRNLRKRKLEEETIEETIARLVRAGLLDDAEFARYWVDNRLQFNPRGAWALRHELRQRGVPEAIVADALSDLDEEAAARRVASSASHRYRRLPPREFVRKMGAFLARRGFSYGVTKPIIDELLEAASHNDNMSSSVELSHGEGDGRLSGGLTDGALSDVESEESGHG
jgi:regulatory protein